SLPLIKERILVIILLLHFLSLMLGSVLVLMLPLLVWLTPDLRIKKSLLKCNWTIRKRLPRCPLSAADLPPSPTKSSNLSETAEVPACNVPSRSPLPALAIAPETKLGTASSGLGTLEP